MRYRPIPFSASKTRAILDGRKTMTRLVIKPQPCSNVVISGSFEAPCPHGKPSDRLWVREAFNTCGGKPFYRADGELHPDWKWRQSMRMPRWASRITLEITAVRVERLRDISEEDAKAEGMSDVPYIMDWEQDIRGFGPGSITRPRFRHLWDRYNAKRGHGWDTNPWVWVITFRRLP